MDMKRRKKKKAPNKTPSLFTVYGGQVLVCETAKENFHRNLISPERVSKAEENATQAYQII